MITVLPYLALVVLATPLDARVGTMIGFWVFAGAVWWIIDRKTETDGNETAPTGAIILPILLIAASRVAPLMRWGQQGLGADSAAYRMNFGKCLETITACAESPISLMAYPLRMAGIPRDLFAPVIAMGIQAFLAFAIYFAAKEMFGKKAALWSITIFAVSMPQFVVYWSLFLNMEAAIALSLLAMIAYRRRSLWAAAGATGAGIFHFVAFVPLMIALGAMVIADKGKRIYAGTIFIITGGIVAVYQAPQIAGYAKNAAGYALGALGNGQGLFLAGHFMPLSAYHAELLPFYLPFGLMGIVWVMRKKQAEIFIGYAIVTITLVAIRGIFHNRFIILFDVACIIFAGWGIEHLWQRIPKTKMNKAIGIAIGLILAGNMAYQSMRMEPLMNREEFTEIRALEGRFAGMPIFVNNPIYRQFVEGYSGHPTIAGEFSREPWRLFGEPSLIYNARRSTPFDPKEDPRALRISDRFWKYE